MQGALVAGAVVRLDGEVVAGTGERPAELGLLGDQLEQVGDERAVAVQQVLDPRDVQARVRASRSREFHSAVKPSAPSSGTRSVQHFGCVRTERGVDGILGHHPVRGVLAAGDQRQPGDGGDDGVLAGELARRFGLPLQQRPEPGVDALDVLVGQGGGQEPVDVARAGSRCRTGSPPGGRGRGPSRCRLSR